MRVILCDLDGALFDSTAAVVRAWRWWAKHRDIDVARVEAVMHGRPSTEVVRLVAPGLDAVAEAERMEAHEARDVEGLVALPGARELMDETPSDRLAAVTSGTRPVATARSRAVGLPMPPVLVTAERVKCGKTHPEGY